MPDDHSTAKQPSRVVDLTPQITNEEALRRIGRSCMEILAHNQTVALEGNAEGVHQMRVSVRRMRATLAAFRKNLRSDQYEWIKTELHWIADVLGEARDLDVFQHSLLGGARESIPESRQINRTVKVAKKIAYDLVQQAIRSPRFGALKVGLQNGFERGGWEHHDSEMHQKLGELAPKILTRRYEAARKLTKGFGHQSEKKRHRLRIALKKLRYTAESLGSIYNTKQVQHFTSQLKQLQDDLGDANDVKAGREIIASMVDKKANPDLALAGHQVLAFHEERISHHEPKVQTHLDSFLETKLFWVV